MKAEARKAELVARAAMLKKKQDLEQEEHQLRQKKVEFDLQTEIAVTDAKTRVANCLKHRKTKDRIIVME